MKKILPVSKKRPFLDLTKRNSKNISDITFKLRVQMFEKGELSNKEKVKGCLLQKVLQQNVS